MVFDPEQLETLKRRAEEDYRLDLAAIERLQRRFVAPAAAAAAVTTSASAASTSVATHAFTPTPQPVAETVEPQPSYSRIDSVPVPAARQDELGNSLRAMFSSSR